MHGNGRQRDDFSGCMRGVRVGDISERAVEQASTTRSHCGGKQLMNRTSVYVPCSVGEGEEIGAASMGLRSALESVSTLVKNKVGRGRNGVARSNLRAGPVEVSQG